MFYLYIYIISNIYYIWTLKRCKIAFNNVFVYVFWGLLLLYPLTHFIPPPLTAFETSTSFGYDKLVQNHFFLTASLALATFAFCLNKYPINKERSQYTPNSIKVKYLYLLYLLVYPFALYFNYKSNWSTGEGGTLASLAAYSRNAITVLSIFYFISPKAKTSIKVLLLLLFFIITFLSTQRTNALILIIAFVYNMKPNSKVLLCLLGGLVLLLMLGSIRNGIDYKNLLYPIYGEGLLGSEGLVQAIEYTGSRGYSYSQFFMLFNQSINWFLDTIHIGGDLTTYEELITNSGRIYYPMGGFYYLSDAYLMHPYLGPVIYTGFIYWFYRKSINKYYLRHDPWSLICISMLFVSVKGSLATFVAMLIFNYLLFRGIIFFQKRHKKTSMVN